MQLIFDGPADARQSLVLAHGAGAGMQTPFMDAVAQGVAEKGVRVVRFEFTYMESQRETGKKKPPDREPALRQRWLDVIARVQASELFIGGKSMGGRIASLIADDVGAKGLVCLGYPFHPVGKPDKLRIEHLLTLKTPALILQGVRDSFGDEEEVAGYGLPASITVHWLADGDHSFKPRVRSGRTWEDNLAEAVAAIGDFLSQR